MNGFLNATELLAVILLIILLGWEILRAFRSRAVVSVYRPTLFVAVILIYYALVGPLLAIATGETTYRDLEHRDLLIWGWSGAGVFYGSLLLGFYATPKLRTPRRLVLQTNPEQLHRLGLRLCQVGLLMFLVVAGTKVIALLNPLAAGQLIDEGFGEGGVDVGGIANYFNYAVNFLIPGVCMMSAAWMRQKRHAKSLLLWFFASFLIYISLGFRYRLVLLIIPLLLLFFLARSRRPSFSLLAIFLVGFLSLNGLIVLTRSYGRGLDLAAIEGKNSNLLAKGLQESVVFFTTSGVMEQVPDRSPMIGAAPFVAALLFPIPRAFFPGKPDASYVTNATTKLYGGEVYARGTAFLNYAEYYLIAGWPSLIALSALLGWLLRQLWNWFFLRQNEPMAQVVYLVTASYLYVVISRGYLPQVIMLFVFTVAPLFWMYRRLSKPVAFVESSPASTSVSRG